MPEPGLAIDFRVDEGWMGASMALSGFSRIDLRSRTGGVPNLDAEDVPWVDGERLWVEGGVNWAAGAAQTLSRQQHSPESRPTAT